MKYINKDIIRRKLVNQLETKRLIYKFILLQPNESIETKYDIQKKLIELPKNSSKIRIKNRCMITGRGKAVYRDFRLSRFMFRQLALEGRLPGIRKASW
jgi:small subunit ribosomal protein S14